MKRENLFPNLGIGLGLRAPHYSHIAQSQPPLGWFEAISENYMGLSESGCGRPRKILESFRTDYEIVLHGVSLSIGSTDELNFSYLTKLKELAQAIQPMWISEHLCWTGVNGENVHDLLPLPFTKEAINHLASRISKVQDFLGRRILFENVSSYINFKHSEMTEWDFLGEISKQADCGILLDINNVYVNSVNHKFDPVAYLKALPSDRIGQIHLAGHSRQGEILVDTHDAPVCNEVWDLFRVAVKLFGPISTMIEWDDKIPDFLRLKAEADKAEQIMSKEMEVADERLSLLA
ncbi:MAG: DUF692 domain-containing protein [Bdellovibrionales bacterium]